MLRLFFIISFLSATVSMARAQVFQQDPLTNMPYMAGKYQGIKGTPLLFEDWCTGSIYLDSNNIISNYLLNFNALTGELLYLKGEEPFVVESKVQLVLINQVINGEARRMVFRSGFPVTNDISGASYYQVLEQGNALLLKRKFKTIEEYSEYNKADKVKEFKLQEQFFIFRPATGLVKLSKDRKSLLDALTDKKEMLELMMNQQDLRVTKEKDLVKIVAAYNR
jgi:hypothetical protein